jgi:capsular exopolysaccharide synthesis family protein
VTGSQHSPTDLRAYAAVLRRRKWTILLVTLLTVGASLFFSLRQTPMYQASARVLVKPLNPNQILQGFSYAVSMDTEAALVASPNVAGDAAGIVEAEGGDPAEPGTMSTGVPLNTNFLDITYSAAAPSAAAMWSQAYADAYVANRQAQAEQLYQSAVGGYQKQLDGFESRLSKLRDALAEATPAERPPIQADIDSVIEQVRFAQLQLAQVPIPASDSAQVIANAEIPATPYTPDYVRNVALAIAAGLALGVGVAFLREQFDDRMSGPGDMEERIGAPALAVVPHFNVPRKRRDEFMISRDQPKSPTAEAYRTIRTNIEFMSRTNQLKVVGIVSPGLSEGKTTTTANLSHSLAASGKRVVALSCDLRKPKMNRLFGLTNDVGLTDVLTGGVSVGSAVQRVPGVPTLRLLTSGPVPANPAELLGSEEMRSLLSGLRSVADFVVIDTAPVLAVTDALVLAPLCDGIVVVVDASTTTRSGVQIAREKVEQVGGNIVGGVFNNFDPSNAKTYPGDYRYYTSYGYSDEEPARGNGIKRTTEVDPEELWS